MSGWRSSTIGEISNYVNRGFSPKYVETDGELILNQKCIRDGKLNFSFSKYTDKTKVITPEKIIQYGDILINSTGVGTAGRVAINKMYKKITVDSHITIVRVNTEIADPNYVFYTLRPREKDIESIAEGSTGQIELSRERVKSIELFLPPLSEQRAIASVLSSLDDKIDLLHRQNKTLEGMAEALFRQWFGQPPVPLKGVEEGWELVKVGDYVRTNVSSIDKDYDIQIIKYLDTGSLTEGKIESFQEINIAKAPSRARRFVKHNDILISTVRPNQKHYGIIKNPEKDIIVSTGFCVISCDKISPFFIYLLLTTDDMTEYLHSIAEGSTSAYPSLKPSDIENLEFFKPPKDKIDLFAEYANSAWNKIDSNYLQIQSLEKMRDSLLPKLMSGEVRVDL
jgi:type I restriction enzyme S subunit